MREYDLVRRGAPLSRCQESQSVCDSGSTSWRDREYTGDVSQRWESVTAVVSGVAVVTGVAVADSTQTGQC